MQDVIQYVIDHSKFLGIVTGAVGVMKTASDVIRSRSNASIRDKLLLRIQGLVAVRQAMGSQDASERQQFTDVGNIVNAQISEALSQFSRASQEARGRQLEEGELGLVQRLFLLYKPPTARAWIAQIICWLVALSFPFFVLGTWFPTEGDGDGSWAVFVQNWSDPDIYFTFLFLLGVFLLARSWGVSEQNRYLRKQGPSTLPRTGFRLPTLVALFYSLCGVAYLVGAVAIGSGDSRAGSRAGIKIGVAGLIILACGPPIYFWGKLYDRKIPLTIKIAALLLSPTILLALVCVFDIGGIILKEFPFNPIGYWRSWAQEPAVPILSLSFAALPVYAGICCLRSALGVHGRSRGTEALPSA
jgi:hypothetical protein